MVVTTQPISGLFAQDIYRRIEEVIKVDQTDEQVVLDEIGEYVVTRTIRDHYRAILERYQETPNKPHEGIAVWVSGFFGSGKSSFAKILGLALGNRMLDGRGAAARFGAQAGDDRIKVLLQGITEQIPTHAVIFDISTDHGIRTGSQTVTEIMYRLFLESLGYAKDLDLSELEITLEQEGRLTDFEDAYHRIHGKPWREQKGLVAIALNNASRVLHELDPATYPSADSWVRAAKGRADVTPGLLAERCQELMRRRRPGHALVFVIDEIGQFVARDVQKMLDLQGVVQSLGRVGRGKMWVVVTSQERLGELVGGLDDRRVELARLMDRFPQDLQVHLEPADISEVTGKRVLAKNAAAQATLRPLFEANRGALEAHTRLTADIKLPDLTAERFIDLYPLLPYQVDLIIQIVSGLRTQGGVSKHVGGANRTIIKLAQQLLINPGVDLAAKPLGALVTLDQIYNLVEGNISSDIRGKIAALPAQLDHPLAQAVAKAICLLQYVQSVHRTAENIAAALYPGVGAESQLPAVKEALKKLTARHQVRLGDDGYRIPTPSEDDWERQREALSPKSGDENRLYAEIVGELWTPQPNYNFLNTKLFKAGLALNGQQLADGDVMVQLYLAQAGAESDRTVTELRSRSQVEPTALFWATGLDGAIDTELRQVFRSREMLSRKERGAQTKEEARLVSDERRRLKDHQDTLRRLLRGAILRGTVFFRGNDRSAADGATDLSRTVSAILGAMLPTVFDRFEEAASKVVARDIDTLLLSDNLDALPPIFGKLPLLKNQGKKAAIEVERGPLAEVLTRIKNRAEYGDSASGRSLTDELAKEPFGWEFDTVRLFVAALLRAGAIEITSKGQIIESATTVGARTIFSNNNVFRQATFRPKTGTLEFIELAQAAQAYADTFGQEITEIAQLPIATAIREEVGAHEQFLRDTLGHLNEERLPGGAMIATTLEEMRAIYGGREETAIRAFTASHARIKETIHRARELQPVLIPPDLDILREAVKAQSQAWSFLKQEHDLDPALEETAAKLEDLLKRETFYREIPAIAQATSTLRSEYDRRMKAALQHRLDTYRLAVETLTTLDSWDRLDEVQQHQIAEPLSRYTVAGYATPIPQMRADADACAGRLTRAIEDVQRLTTEKPLAKVSTARYFQSGIETEEELTAALDGLREEIAHLLGEGKKVLVG